MVESVFAPIVFVAAVLVVIGVMLYRRSRQGRNAAPGGGIADEADAARARGQISAREHERRRRTGT